MCPWGFTITRFIIIIIGQERAGDDDTAFNTDTDRTISTICFNSGLQIIRGNLINCETQLGLGRDVLIVDCCNATERIRIQVLLTCLKGYSELLPLFIPRNVVQLLFLRLNESDSLIDQHFDILQVR